jgi:hypothetical protein
MNLERFISTLAKLILGAVAISGMLELSTQTATAQSITVTTPFAFSAGSESYPAGTYQFTLLSEWSLSIRNVKGGGERFFTIRPEEGRALGSNARLTFLNFEGHRNLQAVYVPGTDRVAELLPHDPLSRRAKSDASFPSTASSENVTVVKQNGTGR